ncbi:MAG: AraC family transcriptional regulator [Hyphomicrobiales bacterium]|nr:AraC family transcriptional regulator [Hyphomicrobiales bacterium]
MRIDAPVVSRLAKSALGLNPVSFQAAAFDEDQDLRGVAYPLSGAVTGHQPLDAEMIAVLARETAIHLASNYSDVPTPRRDLSGRIATAQLVRVLDYLAAKLDRRLSVAILARKAGLSIAHVSRAFAKKSTGRSPHAYIVGRRIAKAGHLLRNSSTPIDKIAALCGFHDQTHLNRLFKRITGHTPKQYRSRTGG